MTSITIEIRRYLHDLEQSITGAGGEVTLGPTDASSVAAALRYCADSAVITPEIVAAAREYCAYGLAATAPVR